MVYVHRVLLSAILKHGILIINALHWTTTNTDKHNTTNFVKFTAIHHLAFFHTFGSLPKTITILQKN